MICWKSGNEEKWCNPHLNSNSSHWLVRQCVCACGWMCVYVMVSMWVAGWMGDLCESVRKVPKRIGVRISLLFPCLTGKSTESLWLVSIKWGQPFCEFMVSLYSPLHLLLTRFCLFHSLFPSSSLSSGEAKNSFPSSHASKPSRPFIHTSVHSKRENEKTRCASV